MALGLAGCSAPASETVLCTARACADWAGRGLSRALEGKQVGARFGRADQVDGSGTVMERGVRAVIDLRLAAEGSASNASAGSAGLPLIPGVFVMDGEGCGDPANAGFRIGTARGLSGSATKDCRVTVLSRKGND